MSRIACILVSDFPLAALVRSNPEFRDKRIALSHGCGPRAELSFVSSSAAALGIRPGMTAAQAMATVPDLIVTPRSQAAERSAADALLDVAESFSPTIEDGGPGLAYLDLSGLKKLYGSEAEMAAELSRRARAVGLEAAVGIAANKEIAWLAARCGGTRVIEPGMERGFLNWLPLDLLVLPQTRPTGAFRENATALLPRRHGMPLDMDEDLALTLERWGIRRLGDLARLDTREIGSRLGPAGVELVRIARGENAAPLIPRPRSETFVEKTELEYGVEMLEPLGFVMRAVLDRLVSRLKLRGLVAGDILLSLDLVDHRRDERRVAAATNEVRSLLTLVNLSLEAAPPPAAVEAVQISVQPRTPRPFQGDMFLPPAPAPDRLQTTLARLAALCGPERVGTLMPENSHRPEAIRRVEFAPPAPGRGAVVLRPHPHPLPEGEGTERRDMAKIAKVTDALLAEQETFAKITALECMGGLRFFAPQTSLRMTEKRPKFTCHSERSEESQSTSVCQILTTGVLQSSPEQEKGSSLLPDSGDDLLPYPLPSGEGEGEGAFPHLKRGENSAFHSLPDQGEGDGEGIPGNVTRMVLRAIRPAEEVEVMCERGLPAFVRGAHISARVVSIAGPWRRQGEWWRQSSDPLSLNFSDSSSPASPASVSPTRERASFCPLSLTRACTEATPNVERARERVSLNGNGAPFARDYYELALSDGGVYRVFCDLISGRWLVDGIYD